MRRSRSISSGRWLLLALPAVVLGGSTPSSITLNSSPNASVFGRVVTLSAAVTPTAASGNVTFYDGTTVLGTTKLSGGSAALTTILLPSGSRSLEAYYGGDGTFASSSSSAVVQTVNASAGGNFQAPVNYGVGIDPSSIAIGDFNGDGRADLVVLNSVFLGNGDGTFRAPINFDAGLAPLSMAVGDFNGDGKADLAVANIVHVVKGNIVVASGNVSVLLGNGDGTFQAPVDAGTGANSQLPSPQSVAVGDFNGDGMADVAVANEFDGNVSVLLGNGDGTFRASVNYSAGPGPYAVTIGDFNRDGKADLAIANPGAGNVTVLLGNGDGTFLAAVNYSAGANPDSIAIGDFNGDGKADLAISNAGGSNVSVLLGNGDGTFRAPVNSDAGVRPHSIAVGDFDGDGRADLVVLNAGDGMSVLFGNGDATFRTGGNYGIEGGPNWVSVGDFNGDGRVDLAVHNYERLNVSVLLGLPPAPDLSIVITHAGDFGRGQSGATFTITVSNAGYASTSGTVTITDPLPPGVTATNISGVGWTCVLGTVTCTRKDSLSGFASYPVITVTVKVAVDAPGGVTNTIAVLGGGETNLANDASSDFITTFTTGQVAQAWLPLKSPIVNSGVGAALLLTDGTVMAQQSCSGNWFRLTPDGFGNYAKGTWSTLARMPAGYGPNAFSSAVLADGRVVVIGGEYNTPCNGSQAETNLGAIYDPIANMWTPLSAPTGFFEIGDAPNVVLPDGQFLLAEGVGALIAKLDPVSLTWTTYPRLSLKESGNPEEGWTLLPDGTVLTVDQGNPGESERYFPQTDTWASAGKTVAPLLSGNEIGPQVLRPDGTVFVAGATGHTAIYNTAAGTWMAGPDFPFSNGRQIAIADGPAALLPNGNVLVVASAFEPVAWFPPLQLFEFDGTGLNPVPAPPGTSDDSSYYTKLLLLPTGQVLFTDDRNIAIYTATGSADPAWAPTIATAPPTIKPGLSYAITGTQFNGLSQAVAYGDDYQGATNYPLVRITNTATGHVFYARTHDHSTMGVATGSMVVSTQFDVPPSIEGGSSTLVVVANGIPSKPVNLTVALNVVTITTPQTQLSGTATVFYSRTLAASGGTPPYTWSVSSGALPAGLSLSSAGVITGTPTGSGTSNFTLKVTDSASVSATQAFTLTVAASPNFTTAPRIAQVADGASWKTLFAITNLDSSPVTYVFRFWDDNGNPLQLPILNGNAGTLSGTLAPGVTVFAETPGTSPTLFQGWAEVASSGRVGVLTIFRLSVPGRPDSEGTVTGTLSGNRIILPFDNTQGYVTSVGVANTNPTQGITVSLLFRLEDGTQVPGSLSLPAHTHQAFTLPSMFPPLAGVRGSILFSAPSADITVLGLRTNPTNSFTSLGTFQ